MLKIVIGALVALTLALVPVAAGLTGIAAWKILLAAIGLVLFMLAGRRPSPGG